MIIYMKTTYETVVIGYGNHASVEIPDKNLAEIGGNKRAPLKITINGYIYQSTATGVNGKCMVVFATRDREASGAAAGDLVTVVLELDEGYRNVGIPEALSDALEKNGLSKAFMTLPTQSARSLQGRSVTQRPTIRERAGSKSYF